MTDIHDIKPLESLGINADVFLYIVLGVLFLALLGAAVMYLKRRKKKRLEFVDLISPEDAAMNSLESLPGLMNSNGKHFYFQLSLILREYLKKKFHIDATQMTTEELLPRIADLKFESDLFRGFREFVYSSDPIKFAGQPADMKNMKRHLEFVKHFVKMTTQISANNTTHLVVESKTVEKDGETKVLNSTPVT